MARLVYYQNWSTYQHSLWVGIGWSCPAQKERQKEREGMRRLFIWIGGEEAAMRTRRRRWQHEDEATQARRCWGGYRRHGDGGWKRERKQMISVSMCEWPINTEKGIRYWYCLIEFELVHLPLGKPEWWAYWAVIA